MTRAGPPGIQRYAQTWTGDNTTSWHTLRWNMRMGLTMGLSGMFNIGHDVGGFCGPVPDAELLVRWVQACAFNPRCIMNSWKDDGRSTRRGCTLKRCRSIRDGMRLRYRLLPYLYTLYREPPRCGEPMLRPRFFEFPRRSARVRGLRTTSCVGPNLLVAPVVEPGAREREVYLPKGPGGWIDFWSGEHHAGGSDRAAPPLLWSAFRCSCAPARCCRRPIRPTCDASTTSRHACCAYLPGRGRGESEFALYEDDGATLRYREGDYADVHCVLSWTSRAIRVTVRKQGRYALPYTTLRIVVPPGEKRRIELVGEGVELTTRTN